MKAAVILLALLCAGCGPRDDTDPPEGRSGMVPLVDALTGCQYLKGPGYWNGALTPRLDRNGKQVCK